MRRKGKSLKVRTNEKNCVYAKQKKKKKGKKQEMKILYEKEKIV